MKHKVRKPFAVLTSAALSASLLFSPVAGTVFAEETPSDVKITFPDIVPTHWAKSHVAKLAAAGIVKGYTTGNYEPNRNVSQQEAIVMVIRMMGLEDEALAGSDNVATGLSEDKFFTKYVVKAISERMIDLAEETAAAAEGETPWGSRPATREWVSKLVVRALGESPATGALTFADASQISPDASGYVAKSQELQLVTGFTDNTFKPKDAVTRAQIATILSRADQYIADDPAHYTSGYIASRSGTTLQLQTNAGGSKTFALGGETLVFDEAGAQLSLADLTNMKSVRVIHQNDQAYYIEVSDNSVQLESIEGELQAIDLDNNMLVLELANGQKVPYQIAANASVTNTAGSGIALTQLTEGSDLRLQRLQGTEEITALVVINEAYNASGKGVVQAVNTLENKITFTNERGDIVTFPVDASANMTLKGEPISSLTQLQEGDTFSYEIKDSVIVSLDITIQKYVTVTGEFQVYADSNGRRTITILENSMEPKAYLLANNPQVVIEGMDGTTINDLQPGDAVQLRISGQSNQVDRISVTSRNVTMLKSAVIEEFAEDYLMLRDADGKPRLFEITNRSEFRLDGDRLTKQMFATYLTKGRKVNLTYSANELVRLDIVTKVSGTITSINTTSRTITVETSDNKSVTVPYTVSTGVEFPMQTSSSFNDLTTGTIVHITMSVENDTATFIQVENSYIYTLQSVTASSRNIALKDAKGTSTTVWLNSTAKILGKNGQVIPLTELTIGNPVVVNYTGRSITSIQETQQILGKVSTLDLVGGKLAVTDFNNNVRNFDLTKGITVLKGTAELNSANLLQLNDRVMIVEDSQGKPYVHVAQMEVRRFSSYDASKNEISFKLVRLGDQTKFTLSPIAYLHGEDGSALALNRLKENDQLTVYYLDNQVIEMVK